MSTKTTTTVRLPGDLHSQVEKAAEGSDRSFNSFVIVALRNELKRSQWLDNNFDAEARSEDDGK